MALSGINAALITAFQTVAGDYPVAWENRDFTPPSRSLWLRYYFIPEQPAVASLGEDGLDEVLGMIQVDLMYPMGGGDVAANQMADQFRQHFWAGRSFTYGGQSVRIRSTGKSPGQPSDGYYRVSITINWQAFLTRKS